MILIQLFVVFCQSASDLWVLQNISKYIIHFWFLMKTFFTWSYARFCPDIYATSTAILKAVPSPVSALLLTQFVCWKIPTKLSDFLIDWATFAFGFQGIFPASSWQSQCPCCVSMESIFPWDTFQNLSTRWHFGAPLLCYNDSHWWNQYRNWAWRCPLPA